MTILASAAGIGMDPNRLSQLLKLLRERLSADDYAVAESLLRCAIDPHLGALMHALGWFSPPP